MASDRYPGFPDVFWSAGDQAFLRSPEHPIRGRPAFLSGLISPEGNLNYNLLMHRRLFIGAGCILVCRPLAELLTEPRSGYRAFLEDGSIVPALRENADSFGDLATLTVAGGNYADMDTDDLVTYARKLDEAGPTVCHTSDAANQDLMNDLAGEVLMQPAYWTDEVEQPFEVALARELVRSVMEQMQDKGRRDFRPTEFWTFAETLDRRNAHDLAQVVRVESVLHSHGTLAINLNLPLVVPAPYAQPAGRIYGTGTPFRLAGAAVDVPFTSYSEGEIREGKAAIYQMAAALSAQQISEIRQSAAYDRYIQAMAEADRVEAEASTRRVVRGLTAAEIAERAFVTYRDDLSTLVGAALDGRLQRMRFLQRATTGTKALKSAAPTPVGWVAQQITSATPVTVFARAATGTFVTMVGKYGFGRELAQEETRARRSQAHLRRTNNVKAEFFGPVDDRHWWFHNPSTEP